MASSSGSIGGVGDASDFDQSNGPMLDEKTKSINGLNESTTRRFRELKLESQRRMGFSQLLNDEFVNLLLDVYEYHLDVHDDGEW